MCTGTLVVYEQTVRGRRVRPCRASAPGAPTRYQCLKRVPGALNLSTSPTFQVCQLGHLPVVSGARWLNLSSNRTSKVLCCDGFGGFGDRTAGSYGDKATSGQAREEEAASVHTP